MSCEHGRRGEPAARSLPHADIYSGVTSGRPAPGSPEMTWSDANFPATEIAPDRPGTRPKSGGRALSHERISRALPETRQLARRPQDRGRRWRRPARASRAENRAGPSSAQRYSDVRLLNTVLNTVPWNMTAHLAYSSRRLLKSLLSWRDLTPASLAAFKRRFSSVAGFNARVVRLSASASKY